MVQLLLLKGLLILSVSVVSTAFLSSTTAPAFGRISTPLLAASKGGPQIAKPSVDIGQKTAVTTKVGQKTQTKQTTKVKTVEKVKRKDPEFMDPPMYKVMLLGDEDYDQGHVVSRICAVMDDVDENRASSIFRDAQGPFGKAMCGKYPLEHAELYKEQLLRSEPLIYSDLEEENKPQ